MISYISNLNLTTANIIFNTYISFLSNELEINNQLLEREKEKITLLKLSKIDRDYIIHSLEEMQLTNNAYSSLLLSFQKEYINFKKQNLHPLPYYSSQDLIEALNIHWNNTIPKIYLDK